MWLTWFVSPNTILVAAIIDKTVLNSESQGHSSLHWVLNQEKFTKTSTKPYRIAEDYYGFFPLENEKFQLKGLERFTAVQLEQLSKDADLVYFTDTYGIYNSEWFTQGNINERSGMLYGGLSLNDIEFLKLMKEKHKLIITEFNTIGSPTTQNTRKVFEKMFKMKWTGWTARYFEILDPNINKELPPWLINNYKKNHNNQWPFKKSGIAFVNDNEQVLILEEGTHLIDPLPYIVTGEFGTSRFSLPEKIKYPFWFDVIISDQSANETISSFEINTTAEGLMEMKKFGIPTKFPAVTRNKSKDYSFYYFSGDFSDNPVNLTLSYFKGIDFFRGLFYDEGIPLERESFFWKFYRPLLSEILNEYSGSL
ncbi:hypothetical protein ACKGJN_10000 [Gillisia sp. Q332]|uniref:hypothetical protein n=1 Tax=Gillisia xinjiangensis TaxID=3384765 RepID=UPI00391942C9